MRKREERYEMKWRYKGEERGVRGKKLEREDVEHRKEGGYR